MKTLPAVLLSTVAEAKSSAARIRAALNAVAAELERYHGRPFRVTVEDDLYFVMVIVDRFPEEDE